MGYKILIERGEDIHDNKYNIPCVTALGLLSYIQVINSHKLLQKYQFRGLYLDNVFIKQF